jgi:DNA-binding CsgD family transcriptional regulator
LLGRPKGSLGPSKLDGKEGEIQMLLGKRVSKASIAKILDVAPSTLHSFIQSRRLEPKKRRQA